MPTILGSHTPRSRETVLTLALMTSSLPPVHCTKIDSAMQPSTPIYCISQDGRDIGAFRHKAGLLCTMSQCRLG